MQETLQMIALRTVAYADDRSILSAYTRSRGFMSLLVRGGKGREASRRRALLQPMSVVECVADIVPGRDVSRIVSVRPLRPMHGVMSSPIKQTVAMFLAEVLGIVLRSSQPDAQTFDFVAQSVAVLDELPRERTANYHIAFLRGLAVCLGIEPDAGAYRSGMVFDMADGIWRLSAPLHNRWIGSDEARVAAALCRMTYANMHLYSFDRAARNAVLDRIMQFYSLHHTRLEGVKSLDILRSM